MQQPLIRCVYVIAANGERGVVVGFAVPRRTGSAVRRNRVRRLMREAFRLEEGRLLEELRGSGCSATLIFVFRPPQEADTTARLSFVRVHDEISALVGSVLSSMRAPS